MVLERLLQVLMIEAFRSPSETTAVRTRLALSLRALHAAPQGAGRSRTYHALGVSHALVATRAYPRWITYKGGA